MNFHAVAIVVSIALAGLTRPGWHATLTEPRAGEAPPPVRSAHALRQARYRARLAARARSARDGEAPAPAAVRGLDDDDEAQIRAKSARSARSARSPADGRRRRRRQPVPRLQDLFAAIDQDDPYGGGGRP